MNEQLLHRAILSKTRLKAATQLWDNLSHKFRVWGEPQQAKFIRFTVCGKSDKFATGKPVALLAGLWQGTNLTT